MSKIHQHAGAVILFAGTLGMVAGHDQLARTLDGLWVQEGVIMSARVATVTAAMFVLGVTGLLILPVGMLVLRCGISVEALRTCVWTTQMAVVFRVIAEQWTGVLLSGYPNVLVTATAVVLSIGLARQQRRPWGARSTPRGSDPMPHRLHGAARWATRKSA
ncbi:MAG TPA: hypothetical protein VF384_08670 [Planctomycetota bacterium]